MSDWSYMEGYAGGAVPQPLHKALLMDELDGTWKYDIGIKV